MGLRTLDDGGYHGGMNRDKPSWMLKPGEVYDALNMLFDKPGIARQRSGSTALVSGAQTAFTTSIGFCYSQDSVVTEELYGFNGKNGAISVINKTTGAGANVGTSFIVPCTVGRPVRHFGFVIFPSSLQRSYGLAGQTNAIGFAATANVVITAGQQQITLGGADTTANVKVGSVVSFQNAATTNFVARVVSVDSATQFTVWPTPSIGFTALSVSVTSLPSIPIQGGVCVASFQNRLLFGNTVDLGSTTQTLIADRRVYYSPLPTETMTDPTLPGLTYTGAIFLRGSQYPRFNYFDVPGADPIVAMEPISDNELLILTSTHPVIFRGNLITQTTTTSPQITFDISEINEPYGCLSDLTVHRTPRGIVWAGANGIYAYTGGGNFTDLTKGKIATYWRGLARGSNFAIHGAVYVRGQYIISGSSGGSTFALACDMNDLQWGRMSGVGTDIFFGLPRPTDPSQVFAARWWDQAGAAPSMTNGQHIRLESMLDLYTAGSTKTDADATAVPFSLTSRVLAGDTDTQKLHARMTTRYQAAMPAASVTVTAQSRIDAADITAAAVRALGSLSSTEPRVISAATNATPIACTTTVVHGLQSGDYVDINGGTGNTHVNGRWRVTVTSTTAFTLDASSGNGAYNASSASVKKVTETDFATNTLDLGQGVSFVVASSGTVNNFELHGLRVAYYEKPSPVLSA